MGNLFAELKRRHIYRVAAAYAVVAWVLLQLVNNLIPALNLPNSAATLVLVLLAVGFPIVLVFAWVRELPPADDATTRAAAGRLDYVLIGALVVVIALVSYQQLAPSPGARTAQQASVAAARLAAGSPAAAVAIAVLPFANISADAGQEFFADGMTEEISSALAKIPDLSVVARTSAFQFKGQNPDIAAISKALNATHLIEGTVRKAGDRVRITVQLVQAGNGLQMWSESYDRNLTDIFAVQEEIGRAVATSLGMQLGLAQGERLISNRTNDTESYQDYLRAKALMSRRGDGNPLTAPIGLLEQVVARDPGYAPAWAQLAQAYVLSPNYDIAYRQGSTEELRRLVDAALPKAEAAARRAIELDPRNADAFAALGFARALRGRLLEAEDLYKQALALDPANPNALHWYSQLLAGVVRVKEAVVMRQQLRLLEPLVPVFNSVTGQFLWLDGQNEAALAIATALPSDYLFRANDLARIYASMGRYREAADALLTRPAGTYLPGTVEAAVRLLRIAPAPAVRQDAPYLAGLSFVYLYVGAPERALEFWERNVEAGNHAVGSLIWHPSYAPVRKTERFKAFVRNAGLVDYWRVRGWPEHCHPVGADDFVCD